MSTLWTMTLVQVSCFPTAATSWSNVSTSSLIVPMYGESSSSVNLSIVVRVRFPPLFHWMPDTVSLDGAFLWRRMLFMVSLMCRRLVLSFAISLEQWTTIVRSILLGGPGTCSFFSLPFLATLAHVFGDSVSGAVPLGGGGLLWLRLLLGWVLVPTVVYWLSVCAGD